MNIIITHDAEGNISAKLTQYSTNIYYDINTVKLYSDMLVPKTMLLTNVQTQSILEASFSKLIDDIVNNSYQGYKIRTKEIPSKGEYSVAITFTNGQQTSVNGTFKLEGNALVDSNNIIRIIERQIDTTNNSNTLVAQDSRSQELSFLMKEYFDGVSSIDDSKAIYVDFKLPQETYPFYMIKNDDDTYTKYTKDQKEAMEKELEEGQTLDFIEIPFHSERIYPRNTIEENGESWVQLEWLIPYVAATGDLIFALSVLDNPELESKPKYPYIWQTQEAHMQVLPYIGGNFKRPSLLVMADGGTVPTDLINVAQSIAAWTQNGVILNGGTIQFE